MPSISPDTSDAPNVPADSGLRCPTCGYNLTGIADTANAAVVDAGGEDGESRGDQASEGAARSPQIEHRCPECGDPFDVHELRAWLAGPQPIPGWGDAWQPGLTRFVRLFLMTLFRPGFLGARWPDCYSRSSAFRFRATVLVAALVMFALETGVLLLRWPSFLLLLPMMIVSMVVSILVCEVQVSLLLAVVLSEPKRCGIPTVTDKDAAWSLRGMVGVFRSFVIVGILAGWVVRFLESVGAMPSWFLSGNPSFLVAGIWWWIALGIAVSQRPGNVARKVAVFVLLPVLGVVSITIGSGAALLVDLVIE